MSTASAGQSPRSNAAVLYHPDGYLTSRGKLMGRHAAGEGFLRGFVRHAGVDKFYAYAETRKHFDGFCEQVRPHSNGGTAEWLPFSQPERLREPGALYLPGPDLAQHAWQRRWCDPAGYSLTGITHTICTHRVMDSIGELLIAPVEEWDALICTSPAVKQGAEAMLGAYAEYLVAHLGAKTVRTKAQLPVIPLGVDCERLAGPANRQELRRQIRRRHKIGDDEVCVLFFGRLAYHAKAHPMPMYLALEAASRNTGRKVVLIQAGWFANDAIKQAFVQGARSLCPSTRVVYVDGRVQETRDHIWRAADIFCSFSDNVQETFGLTPVEAMAAGLPVVASDWNGYKGTVEHGTTGFLIPTTMPAAGCGAELAYRYFTGQDTYDQYVGAASQAIAVDTVAATAAFTELIQNADLRQRMGEAGRERARPLFDWAVVIAAYQELWTELGARRGAAMHSKPPPAPGHAPLRTDPFAAFGHYATRQMTDETRIAIAMPNPVKNFHKLSALRMNAFARTVFARDSDIDGLLMRIRDAQGTSIGELLAGYPPERHNEIRLSLGWVLKMGLVKLAPPPDRPRRSAGD